MFGGIHALHCPQDRLYTSPADNLPRFEFSDADARFDGFLLHDRQRSIGQRRAGWLGEILRHDELYRHYPELARIRFVLTWAKNRQEAQVSGGEVQVIAAIDGDGQKTRKHLCHEAQHLIQMIEGFSPGGSPEHIFNRLANVHKKVTKQVTLDPKLRQAFEDRAYTSYRNLPGEKEAWDVEARIDWSMEQRLATLPVNARLAEDDSGVTFAPRKDPSPHTRVLLARFAQLRRQLRP